MTYRQAQTLLNKDISRMTLNQLQKHRVKLIDAHRESCAEYGFNEAVKNGFYLSVIDAGASGFIPKDLWLSHKLKYMLEELIKAETKERDI